MATSRFKDKRWRVGGSIILGLLVILIVLSTLPLWGGESDARISSGTATKGGFYGLHFGAYE